MVYFHISLLKFNLVMDEYEDDPGRPAKDKHIIGYAKVHFYAYVTLTAHPSLGIAKDKTDILAIVSLCRTNGEDASQGPVWYDGESLESIRAFSARAVAGVIGRVKVGNRWGIVDRCWGLQGAAMEGMIDPDYESEDNPND